MLVRYERGIKLNKTYPQKKFTPPCDTKRKKNNNLLIRKQNIIKCN